jgi:hypothetical protein
LVREKRLQTMAGCLLHTLSSEDFDRLRSSSNKQLSTRQWVTQILKLNDSDRLEDQVGELNSDHAVATMGTPWQQPMDSSHVTQLHVSRCQANYQNAENGVQICPAFPKGVVCIVFQLSPCPFAVIDLYCSALQHGMQLSFSDAQVSALVGITKAVHENAMALKQPMHTAFKHCSSLLLSHSIERPPCSTALFSLEDMHLLSAWFSHNYFMHYSMYQYIFTPYSTVSFKTRDPRKLIEVPAPLPALNSALPETEFQQLQIAAREIEQKSLAVKLEEVFHCAKRMATDVE